MNVFCLFCLEGFNSDGIPVRVTACMHDGLYARRIVQIWNELTLYDRFLYLVMLGKFTQDIIVLITDDAFIIGVEAAHV